jgi:AcrR family transcriptional regulator
MKDKRTQAERTAHTRAALVHAARPLFTTRGYAAVGTDELAEAAGVTRGALYHQFGGKEGLFVAVFEQAEQDVVRRLSEALAAAPEDDLAAVFDGAVDAWLDICAEPEVHQIVLVEAPAVLGWERWREIGRRYGVGMVEAFVGSLIEAGALADQPARPLAHVVVGAFEEAALYAARADDQETARAEVRAALRALLDGLVTTGGASPPGATAPRAGRRAG